MQMVIYMKVNGKMIKQMVMVNIYKKMELYLKEIGKMINKMVKELKFGDLKPNLKVILLKEKNRVKEN